MPLRPLPLVVALLSASAALAHSGVSNPAVKARMHTMMQIADNTKVLGDMAKGKTAFDAEAARAAAAAIAAHSASVTALFSAEEQDPKSEALPAIWQDFETFSRKSEALTLAAAEAAGSIQSEADLKPALAGIGGACKSCHMDFRKPQ
ncbi:cytochrome c [Ruegeria pomeroyi]|uniref:Cytochrome c n=2 Tax=Ruegeria pomeroyi TaxID=89184 RepID=Q5LQ02_RUEPO|nr:cytochrome c [Ruegeria pomeroyi]AAV95939.1 cytochrome c' [Ruegeria pomeroyi DSS-3]NVK98194.1 cytochrome c [Ruegeria pomeroyi]NVL02027.1 cytochrome c [Ruegeria pomeroyi]QWV09505.1 cytochrome c [Ruegeria pomeroyi]